MAAVDVHSLVPAPLSWRRTAPPSWTSTRPSGPVAAWSAHAVPGEALLTYTSEEHGGRLLTTCGNRRAAVCPSCARVYRADTYQLIRAGLVGGKEITAEIGEHPRVFATLTAPGFGPVHTRRERDGKVTACRPRKASEHCLHGCLSLATSGTRRVNLASANRCACAATTTRGCPVASARRRAVASLRPGAAP
ncbi:replication initiator [Wenjunlia tyrosinilytica]|uniref:replication initiator n=1 Tax=Wenjunlia tyrosinilytica TaxID=1544741 RepID=UPI003570AAFB